MPRSTPPRLPKAWRKKNKGIRKTNVRHNLEPKLQKVREIESEVGYLEEIAAEGAVMLAPTEKFRDAIIGLDIHGRFVYSRERILECFMKDGMSLDEADEFCSYNTERALDYVEEEKRPIILAFEMP